MRVYRSASYEKGNGGRYWTSDPRKSISGIPHDIGCGQCIECRLQYARDWSIRLEKENRMHDTSSFVTLTYDDENLPYGGTLVKEDIAAFHKRLHNRLLRSRGYGIRFYYAGEYGELLRRPHYHSIIFGFDFPDKKFYKENDRGEPIYVSDYLRDLWPAGRNGIGLVTFDSCMYVAGYVTKKITKPHDAASEARYAAAYGRYDADGRYYTVLPEFCNMSRGRGKVKGIGSSWLAKFGTETYRDDSLVVNGASVRPPRYFDNLFEEVDADRVKVLKSKRRANVEKMTSRQSYARERITKGRLGLRKKDVE